MQTEKHKGLAITNATFSFGQFLHHLRKRAALTQTDLAVATGYTAALISHLEHDRRLPDVHAVMQLFIPALNLQDEPQLATRLVELAALAHGDPLPRWRPHPSVTQAPQRNNQSPNGESDATLPLPITPTTLVGRQQELKILIQRFVEQRARLVTLLGPPGVGKTRLALEVAQQVHPFFGNGAVFVPLAALRDPALLASALCDNLGVKASGHGLEAKPRLIQYLRHQEILLVLDNFEQLLTADGANRDAAEREKNGRRPQAAVALLAELLAACPTLHLLVTSRESLHLRAEQRYRLPPLALPAAVELFVQRAQALQPTLTLSAQNQPAIETLCRQLDCLPLAIELVSMHSDQFSPKQLVTRLRARSLDLLNDGAYDLPIHQRTLRTAIESSYELLTDAEQQLFRALSVFTGGFDGEAVAALGFEEGLLHNLINKSLVSLATNEQDEPRYWLLETLHQYSHEQLQQQDEAHQRHAQHAAYFLAMAEKFSLYEPTDKLRYWFNRLCLDYENVQATLAWSVAQAEVELAARFIWPLNWFWDWRQDVSSTVYWTRQVVALAQQQWPHLAANSMQPLSVAEPRQLDLLARVWYILACCTPDPEEEKRAIAHSMALNRLLAPNDLTPAIYHTLAFRENARGNFAYADECFAKALQSVYTIDVVAKPVRQNILGWTIKFQGKAAFGRGELLAAKRFLEQCIPLFAEIGQTFEVADTHLELQEVMLYLEEFAEAQKHYDLALAGFRAGFGKEFEQVCAWHRGLAAIRQAQWQAAAVLLMGRFQQLPINETIVLEYNDLWRLMQVAANTEQYGLAATLIGAIEQKSHLDRWFLQPIYRPEYAAAYDRVRSQLVTGFEAAYDRGVALTEKALLALVLANFQLENRPFDRR